LQPQTPHLDHIVVIEEDVVPEIAQHRRVEGGHRHLVSGLAHRGDRLNVIVVPVGLQHSTNTQSRTDVEQLLVFVGRVDEHSIARGSTTHHEHVVVVRTDDELVHLDTRVGPMQRGNGCTAGCHTSILARGGKFPRFGWAFHDQCAR
jgi:hypothetical protein